MKKLSFIFAIIIAFALFTLSAFSAENVVYVNGTVSTSGNGLTPATAFKSLNEGIDAVKTGGTIVLTGDVTFTRRQAY